MRRHRVLAIAIITFGGFVGAVSLWAAMVGGLFAEPVPTWLRDTLVILGVSFLGIVAASLVVAFGVMSVAHSGRGRAQWLYVGLAALAIILVQGAWAVRIYGP
jgi:hypothetical protein